MRLSIHIVTKGRNDCLAVLLEKLRSQTHKEWDLVILDNNLGPEKGEPKAAQHPLIQGIFNRLQFEGHRIHVRDNSGDPLPRDIGRYRNMIIEADPFAVRPDLSPDQQRTNIIGVRIDDDSIVEMNYLEILNAGFKDSKVAVTGGICPYYHQPQVHAPIPAKFNQITPSWEWTDNCIHFYRMLDAAGNDRHWSTTFYESGHIRSNYAYRINVAREIKFPEHTGQTGFSEETVFCARAWMSGYKVLINPNAVAWHLPVGYGGGRDLFAGKTPEQAAATMEEIKRKNTARLKEELEAFRKEKGLEPRSYP